MKRFIPRFEMLALLAVLSFLFFSCTGQSKPVENKLEEDENMEVGVGLYSFNRFPFEKSVEMAKGTNAQKVEGFSFHNLGDRFGGKVIANLSDEELSMMKGILDSNQVQMVSMYADGKTIEDWEQLFKQGQKLGLQFLVGEPDPLLLDKINELAGQYKLPLAIHEHAKGLSRYWHPDSAMAAVEGREHLKICADIGHWVRSGLDPVECLQKVEHKLLSLHVKDLDGSGNMEAKDVAIGAGVIDYNKVFAELKRQDFSGEIFIECEHNWDNNFEEVKESVNYMRQKAK
ncbi:sugar phosphate isomerase/epimerase family protein [Sphingobacterium mizutaii]|uniref:sugar phosphate isomerase/epimerase family protein n=1 Tax=Sphingobacterium mizutaii TaxID=1010 RepID=UPI001623776C|nr:sugar phosphate isomerase/epimerase [Sphingobacterium mizutaii]